MSARRLEARFLNCLRGARGGLVTKAELIEAVWYDDPTGGPDNPAACLRQYALRLRQDGYPVRNFGEGRYRFVPTLWELSDMADAMTAPKTPLRRQRNKPASEYLPPGEAVRVARTIDSLKEQLSASNMNLANAVGWLAAKDHEITLLQGAIAELTAQREAAWAKPANAAP